MSAPLRVLIVEDEPLVRSAYVDHLRRVPGYELHAAVGSAARALRILTAEPAAVDVVLLDMHLPDAHGLDLLRRVRAHGIEVDVIAVTAAREVEVVRRAVSLGVMHYLVKPFRFPDVAARLADYAEYRRRLGPATGSVPLGQAEIDGAMAALREPAAGTPKGLAPETLARVEVAVRSGAGAVSAGELAPLVEVSRITARRYLEFLVAEGRLVRQPRHGGAGRPELEYAPPR